MIFRRKSGTDGNDDAGDEITYVVLFDERSGTTPLSGALTAREARQRWAAGEKVYDLPAHAAGEVVPWSIVARRDHEYVVNHYGINGRRVHSVRWEQNGDRIRAVAGEATFTPIVDNADSTPGSGIYAARWTSRVDGAIRFEIIAPSAAEDKVVAFHREAEASPQRLAPGFDALPDLLTADAADAAAFSTSDPRLAADQYVRARMRGAVPLTAEDVLGQVSLGEGAVVLATARQIFEVVDRLQRHGTRADIPSAWTIPVLWRGEAIILPLGAQGTRPERWSSVQAELTDLANSIRWALEYRAGGVALPDLSEKAVGEDDAYRAALVAIGATRAGVWRPWPGVAVVLVSAGDPLAGTLTRALHIVPARWVTGRGESAIEQVNVSWTWSDVVAQRGESEAPDSLERSRREDQGS